MIVAVRILRDALRRGDRATAGTALIEFAMVLPALLLLFLGGYQMSDASACKRKVTITSRALADMVSQYTTMTAAEADTVLAASTQIMAPYSVGQAQVRVSEITLSGGGKKAAKIIWSRGRNALPRDVGSYVAEFPADLRVKGDTYIFAEVIYAYKPQLGSIIPPVNFGQTLYMLPRKSATVSCDDC